MLKISVDEEEILKLIKDHLVPLRAILQWWPTKGEDIPTPSTLEIVVSKAFFQREFGRPSCDFFHD
jgi:hypothetical protein